MMTRIFGAVLIVSGGFLIGKVCVFQSENRLKILAEIYALIEEYFMQLKQYRRSIAETIKDRGVIAEMLLSGDYPTALTSEDRKSLSDFLNALNSDSYQRTIEVTAQFLQKLQTDINKLKEESASQWKAIPLVTASIGFLIAVLLF